VSRGLECFKQNLNKIVDSAQDCRRVKQKFEQNTEKHFINGNIFGKQIYNKDNNYVMKRVNLRGNKFSVQTPIIMEILSVCVNEILIDYVEHDEIFDGMQEI